MQDAFEIVVFAVVIVGAVVGVVFLVGGGRSYRQIGRGPLSIEPPVERPAPAADPELRDEIRELVRARNARRVAGGEEPLDVEAEVERRLRELGG